ncbi:S-layer homology domain-containing protein [Megasphaera elsdenii]|uniref:S-layer homology domain-containing protein n=1 Tax=Megasphaera elsdenii TaxID=907 RepID=UPI0024309228|nr:S-layer homology domain-containing protein [Megasphaera elsdenii]
MTNVAAGSLGTDAVNVAQLRQVQTKHTQVTVEGGTDAGTTAKDGTRTYTGTNLKLNQLTDQNGATVYDLKLADTVTIGGKDGADGTNGVDGHIGVRGKDGEKGKDGQNAYSDITTHFGPATLNPDKNVKIIKDDVETDAATRLHYVDQNNKEHEVGTMDDGQKYAGDFGDGASVKLNKTVTIKGKVKADAKEDDFVDGNIAVVANKKGEDGELLIKLNKDLTGLNSATYTTSTKNGDVTTTSTTVVDGTGLKIENGPSITNTGIDGGSKKITNVADGEISATSKDAVNGSQLNDVKNLAEQHTTVEAGPSGNVTVTPGTNADGSKKYTVDLAKDVTFGDTAKGDKTVAISGTDGTITAGTGDNKVTVDGSKGQIVAGGNNGVKIGNIENGDSSLTIYDKDSKATGKTDKAGKYVTNLDNKTWKDDGSYVSGRAATEDQLHQVESNVNKQIADVNTKIDKVDKHHTEVTVNGGTAAKADGSYTDGNLQIAQKTGSDGQKIYDLKLSDNLNIGGAGKDGKDGQNGHMGINGADGKSGIGIDGEDGISIKGKDGKDGVTIKGIDGKNGTEGHIGLTGSAGKDGQNASADIHVKNGQVGVDGTDGHGGKDGMDRVVYEDHNHVTHEVATMDDGMKYSGDSGKAAVKLNKNVQVYGGATEYADGNNIGVVASQDGDNAKLQVKLAKDFKGINSIEAKTITTGDTTMDNSGLTVKGDGNHKDITIHQGNVNMGGNKVSGVADGKVSQDSTDAVNGSQLWQRDQAINGLSGSVNKLGNRINRVGAGAAALAALHPLDFDPDDKWDFAAGYGNYRGANAAAVGAYYRPNEDTMFSVGGSFGGGENMVNAGVSIKLGQGNHVSTSRVAMAKEMKAMRQHMAEQDALIAKLQSMHGMAVDPAKSTLFPDVAENHWAYQYVTTLAKKGILEGYPDGEFKGDRMMTRYEFAAIVYRIVESGVGSTDPELSKLVKEFSPELQYIRIDTIQKDRDGKPTIERVRVISDAK